MVDSSQINANTPLHSAFDLFQCGLCKHVVTPYPKECPNCNKLYCEACVKIRNRWTCVTPQCGSKQATTQMNGAVREILESLQFCCPGCTTKLKYFEMHKHITSCQAIGSDLKKNSQQATNPPAQVAPASLGLGNIVYVFDKDSKSVFLYDIARNHVTKSLVLYAPSNERSGAQSPAYPHNYTMVQVGNPAKVFMLGGGDFNFNPNSMYEACELTKKSENQFELVRRSQMSYPRHGHAACAVKDRYLVVTGSRKDIQKACSRVELYDVQKNKWSELPMLNQGRHYHASCHFNSEWIYVFCGISNQTKKYLSTVERLHVSHCLNNMITKWEVIQIKNSVLNARQGLGAAQLNKDGILIMGGFGGKYSNESTFLDVKTNKIYNTTSQLPSNVFPFAVPTLSSPDTTTLYTIDWVSYNIFRFKNEKWENIKALKN